jgi:hypothetical protein
MQSRYDKILQDLKKKGTSFMKLILTPALTALLLFSGCDKNNPGKDSSTSKLSGNATFSWSEKTSENPEIKVFNQFGEPIEGAQILIGDAQDTPFRGNFLTTNRSGSAVIPAEWTIPASVTVDAAGYIRQTLLNQRPGDISIRLNKAYLPQFAEIRGNVTGLPVQDGDKLIDFALAMPLLKKNELLGLDLSQVISPYSDTISAAGQKMSVPSNISLPKQKENYIIGITLDKPVFRLKTPTLGNKKLVSIRGRFVFKTVVDQFRAGKAFYEVLNEFSFMGGGVADASVLNPVTNVNIPGTALTFNGQVQVNAVPANADEVPIVLAAAEMDGYMVPTDVKRTTAGKTTTLQTLPNQPTYIVSAIKKQSEFMANTPGADRISASSVPYSRDMQNKLLPLVENPSVTSRDNYVINMPPAPTTDKITPVAVTAILSDLVESKEGDATVVSAIHKWEVVGAGWSSQINLPKWPQSDLEGSAKKRVEINFIGISADNAVSCTVVTDCLNAATHLTHASADF